MKDKEPFDIDVTYSLRNSIALLLIAFMIGMGVNEIYNSKEISQRASVTERSK